MPWQFLPPLVTRCPPLTCFTFPSLKTIPTTISSSVLSSRTRWYCSHVESLCQFTPQAMHLSADHVGQCSRFLSLPVAFNSMPSPARCAGTNAKHQCITNNANDDEKQQRDVAAINISSVHFPACARVETYTIIVD
jgi:hypothetical protein